LSAALKQLGKDNKEKRGGFAAASFFIDLFGRQSHWLDSRDTESEPLFPWFSVPLLASTFRFRSTHYLCANKRPNWPGILNPELLIKYKKINDLLLSVQK